MIYPLYSIRDNKTSFMAPQPAETEEQAIRNFSQLCNTPGSLMGFAPADFDLYKVGTFDTQKGVVAPSEPIQLVVSGASVLYEK